MKRILICGGRDYGRIIPGRVAEFPRRLAEKKRVSEVLGKLMIEFGAFQMIHGGAQGADSLAHEWAKNSRGLPKPIVFEALWDDVDRPGAVVKVRKSGPRKGTKFDAAAGPRRNQRMIEEGKPELVVAFPGGEGTEDMISRAEKAGIEVRRIL